MAREHNYLLAQGERLAATLKIKSRGDDKNPPYLFPNARDRLVASVQAAATWAEGLPKSACPHNQVVLETTLHPRYISKSDQPLALFRDVGLSTIGRKSVDIRPEAWGVKKHPEVAATDKLFVTIRRDRLLRWAQELPQWTEKHAGAKELTQIEHLSPFYAESKLLGVPSQGDYIAELVLHNVGRADTLDLCVAFARSLGAEVLEDRKRVVGWLSFIPVRLSATLSEALAAFALVRALRPMPVLRRSLPDIVRSLSTPVALPDVPPLSDEHAVIFDGGLPPAEAEQLSPWVTSIDPPGIGAPHPDMQHHGLAVTSSFLFGPLNGHRVVRRPVCRVTHVRVLDENTGNDLEYYDVLDRITGHLDAHRYRFASLSLGPRRPVEDDEITAWTAELDFRLAHAPTLMAVAVGNDGDRDGALRLNRIQPPSDGVNVFAIGACDSMTKAWSRTSYSCVGPGRNPGMFKPDGLAFGGSQKHPFFVVGPGLSSIGVLGTSFAAPFALHTCVGVAGVVDTPLAPLTLRALAIHRAEPRARQRHADIGWGRFLDDPHQLITCDDCESVVVYQGELPSGEHLRAALALPPTPLQGEVKITATLVIAPEVDPEHTSTYTRGGLGVTFRPDATNFQLNEKGVLKDQPETMDFFNSSRLKGRIPEYVLRSDAHKWEPVIRATRRIDANQLNRPFFDIYYNRRERGASQQTLMPLRYALVVTVRCEAMPDLYDRVAQAYATILAPLQVNAGQLRLG